MMHDELSTLIVIQSGHLRSASFWAFPALEVCVTLEASWRRLNLLSSDWDDFNEYVAKMQLEDAPLAGNVISIIRAKS